jgi:hypothetical protein
MFRKHNLTRKNIKNEYSISTTNHESSNITSTNIGNKTGTDLEITATAPQVLKLNSLQFPASDGTASQVLSTNGNGVLSFISTITGELINDTTPQLSGDLDINSNNIGGNGNIDITGSIQCSSSLTCSDLNVNGTTTHINTSTITIDDPLIYLGENNSANTIDLGWYGKYNDGSDKYAGVFRDATDGKIKFFSNTTTEPSTTISSFNLCDIECGNITGTIQTTAQPNITSVGTLTGLTVSGNVGMGTDNPASITKLHLFDDVDGTGKACRIQFTNTNSGATSDDGFYVGLDGSRQALIINQEDNAMIFGTDDTTRMVINGSNGHTRISNRLAVSQVSDATIDLAIGDSDTGLNQEGSNKLAIYTAGNERMRIDSSGNIGIGTNNPTEPLHIYSNADDGIQLIIQNDYATSRAGVSFINDGGTFNIQAHSGEAILENHGSGNMTFYQKGAGQYIWKLTDSNTEVMRILNNGNVGIGTNNPTEKFHIEGDLLITGNIVDSSGTHSAVSKWAVSGSDIYNTNSGNVGIGTNDPTATLHIHSQSSSQSILRLSNTTSGTNSNDGFQISTTGTSCYINNKENAHMVFSTNNTEKMRIENNGKVGIGTNDPNELLEIYSSGSPSIILNAGTVQNAKINFFNRDDNQYMNWADRSSLGEINFMGEEALSGESGTGYDIAKTFARIQGRIHTDNGGSSYGWIQGGIGWYTNAGDGGSGVPVGDNLLERMTLSYVGYLGIGSTSPSSALTVAIDDNTNGQVLVTATSNTGQTAMIKIRGRRNASTSNNHSQLLFENYDHDSVSTNKLGMISGRVSDHSTNIGDLVFSTYADGSTESERMRIESGGDVKITSGTIYGSAGTVQNMEYVEVGTAEMTQSVTYIFNSTSWVEVFEYMYTPKRSPCRLIVEIHGTYYITGYGSDSWAVRLMIDERFANEQRQYFLNQKGGGTRGSTLLPIMGSNTINQSNSFPTENTIPIWLEVKKLSGDDNILWVAIDDHYFRMTITEISV